MRIPKTFVETSGFGQSNLEIHAGAFHHALKRAGIADYNIVKYSSILPATAIPISWDEFEQRKPPFGAELFCIMSQCDGEENQLLTAGIVWAWLYDNVTDEKIGGLVCEIQGHYTEDAIRDRLKRAINELYIETYSEDYYIGEDLHYIISSFEPTLRYGSAVAALCFIDYI